MTNIHRTYSDGYGSLEHGDNNKNNIKMDNMRDDNDNNNKLSYPVRGALITLICAMLLTIGAVTMTINKQDNILNLSKTKTKTNNDNKNNNDNVIVIEGNEESIMETFSSSSMKTPLTMFKTKTKDDNLVNKFFEKYFRTTFKDMEKEAIKNTKKNDKTTAKHIKKDSTQGWAYADMYSGQSCDGNYEGAAGIVTNTCIKYGSYGLMFTCDDSSSGISYYYWKDNTCSGSYSYSGTFADKGCMLLSDSYYSNDDDTYGAENSPSVNIQCSTTSTVPLQSGSYDIMKAYIEDSTTCDDSAMILYEAGVPDECVALHEHSKDYSMMFLNINDSPYLKYYSQSDECSGSYAEYEISTSCSKYATDSDQQINYKWGVETY